MFIIALAIAILAQLVNRFISKRAYKKLGKEDHNRITKFYSQLNSRTSFPFLLIVLLSATLILIFSFPAASKGDFELNRNLPWLILFMFLLISSIVRFIFIWSKFIKMGIPKDFIKNFVAGEVIGFTGTLFLLLNYFDWENLTFANSL